MDLKEHIQAAWKQAEDFPEMLDALCEVVCDKQLEKNYRSASSVIYWQNIRQALKDLSYKS